MRDVKYGQIVIIDWGFSVYKNDEHQPFMGGLDCDADYVLKAINKQQPLRYQPQFDLISFVRTFYMKLHGNDGIAKLDFGQEGNNHKKKTHVESVIEFW